MRSESEMKEIVGPVGKYMVDRGVFDPLRAWKNVTLEQLDALSNFQNDSSSTGLFQ